MNREFLDLYERELKFFFAHAEDFAAEYPGIAQRLGGLARDRSDPMIGGLLEGAAFLAARVQLKLKSEFPEFINNLLDQLVPNYLAPTPSCILARVKPTYGDPSLREGRVIARGSNLDAAYVKQDSRVACRFKSRAPVTLWPFEITGAEYYQSSAPMQALGAPVTRDAVAGLRLTLTCRTMAMADDEPDDETCRKLPESWFAGCKVKNLPIQLVGPDADADALCEQLFAHNCGTWFRYLDDFGDPKIISGPENCLAQVGFDEAESLFPNDDRVFQGFDLLREYFVFPRRFLGFDITRLEETLARVPSRTVDIIFAFNERNMRLVPAVKPEMFALYTTPAVNLFEMNTDRVQVRSNQNEYHVVADKSRYLDFEPHRILDVYAHRSGGGEKIAVRPLYSILEESDNSAGLVYTVRRIPRRRTIEERRYGTLSHYVGSDIFLSLGDQSGLDDDHGVAELSVRALCSNRHLTESLPSGDGEADFRFVEDESLSVQCIAGPTLPRESIVSYLQSRTEVAHTGVVAWRLLNMLSLNHLGLVEHGGGKNAQALREMLSMFADLTDTATERRIRGILSVDSRRAVRRIRQSEGIGPARGSEITVTLDGKAFEGSGAFLLGAVLDRFYAEYASFNHFTQLIVRTPERGEVMRWPPRIGRRRLL